MPSSIRKSRVKAVPLSGAKDDSSHRRRKAAKSDIRLENDLAFFSGSKRLAKVFEQAVGFVSTSFD
jgi:hypothetical protein